MFQAMSGDGRCLLQRKGRAESVETGQGNEKAQESFRARKTHVIAPGVLQCRFSLLYLECAEYARVGLSSRLLLRGFRCDLVPDHQI